MENAERDSGIEAIGDIPWGTHFCLFYKTCEDFFDILIPFIEAGLRNNEFCMCVAPDAIKADEIKRLLGAAMPNFDDYVSREQIEIISCSEWYLIDGAFDSGRVMDGWNEKLRRAREMGFDGVRVTGDTFWVDKPVWGDFLEYERAVDGAIEGRNFLVLCTYPLNRFDAGDVLDVVSAHHSAMAIRDGEWCIIGNVEVREARRALRESEEKLTHVASFPEMNPNPILEVDGSGAIIYSNPAADQLFPGLRAADTGNPLFQGITPDVIKEGGKSKFTRDVQINDAFYQQSIYYIPDKKTFRIYFIDITERIQAEEAMKKLLHDLGERIRELTALHASYDIIQKGRSVPEVLRGITDILPRAWQYPEAAAARILFDGLEFKTSDFMETQWVQRADFRTSYGKHGSIEVAYLEKMPDEDEGPFLEEERNLINSLAEMVKIYLDKLYAEEALANAKSQAELYLDLMGHDIANMHQIALGYLEMAGDMLADERQALFLDKPVEVLHRSMKLIQNVKKLQKLHDGIFQAQDIDVCEVLVDVQRECSMVSSKMISLNMNGVERCHVRANELLRDVFANLVNNATKYTGDYGEVVMDLDIVKGEEGRYCRVAVEDDGPGIPDDFKAKIFNRMLKGSDRAKGMGLGLYLVKTLVESYGGRVWVEDRVAGDRAKGARFVVMLPEAENGHARKKPK